MTQADPVMGAGARARNHVRPEYPTSAPDVTALLDLAARQPLPPFALLHVEMGHPEERLAELALGVARLATEAFACLAEEATCEHLAEGLWQHVAALEDAPALQAPLPDPAADLADYLHDVAAEERAFGTGRFGPGGRA